MSSSVLNDGPACRVVLEEMKACFNREKGTFLVFSGNLAPQLHEDVFFISQPAWLASPGFQEIWNAGGFLDRDQSALALVSEAGVARTLPTGEFTSGEFRLGGEDSPRPLTWYHHSIFKRAFERFSSVYASVVDPSVPSWNVSEAIREGNATPVYPQRRPEDPLTPHAGAECYIVMYGKNVVSVPGHWYRFCEEQGFTIFAPQTPVSSDAKKVFAPHLASFRRVDSCEVMGLISLSLFSGITEDELGRPMPCDPAGIVASDVTLAAHSLVWQGDFSDGGPSGRLTQYSDYREALLSVSAPGAESSIRAAAFRAGIGCLQWAGWSDEDINNAFNQTRAKAAMRAIREATQALQDILARGHRGRWEGSKATSALTLVADISGAFGWADNEEVRHLHFLATSLQGEIQAATGVTCA